jgi:GTP diphosphokinase / guanosine-3',5'-bis(diphosphate) 3'-diphosphatase
MAGEAKPKKEQKINTSELNVNNFIEFCKQKFTKEEFELINKALIVATDAHKGIKRDTGEEYITHPISAAIIIIKEFNLYEYKLVIAALMHDVIEDTDKYGKKSELSDNQIIEKGIEAIDKDFNDEDITDMIMALSKFKRRNRDNKIGQFEKDRYVEPLAKFPNAVIVKAADRLHNLRTMPHDEDRVRKYIIDTEEYILPCLEYCLKGNEPKVRRIVNKADSLIEAEIKSLKLKYKI